MSAFFVSPETIDDCIALIREAEARGVKIPPEAGLMEPEAREVVAVLKLSDTDLGRALWQMNAAALWHRYRDHPSTVAAQVAAYETSTSGSSLIQRVKSLACFLYQCNEGDVPQRALYRYLVALERDWAATALRSCAEWQEAKWGR